MARVVLYLPVSKISDDKRTSSLLLMFDTDSFETTRYLGIQDNTDFDTAKEKLKADFVIMERPEKLKDILGFRRQEAAVMIKLFTRDIKIIGHMAYTGKDPELLEDIMIHIFIRGLRDEQSRERVLLKSPKILTEAAQYAGCFEAATRVVNTNLRRLLRLLMR